MPRYTLKKATRLPDFVTKKDFDWAVETAIKKKKIDCSLAEFLTIEEGLCVQIMHQGAFDDEPATVSIMDAYLQENGYVNDFTDKRMHHEINFLMLIKPSGLIINIICKEIAV